MKNEELAGALQGPFTDQADAPEMELIVDQTSVLNGAGIGFKARCVNRQRGHCDEKRNGANGITAAQ